MVECIICLGIYLKGLDEYKHLSYASSLCGNCTEVCPVRINLHELLLENRHEAVDQGFSSFGERMAWKVWKRASLSRKMMNMGNSKIKNWVINKFVKDWTKHRGPMNFPDKSFNQLWQEKNGK